MQIRVKQCMVLSDQQLVRVVQVPGVGNVLAQRLATAGIRSIQEFLAADPRQLELVTTKLYPWGDTKREDAKRLLPPPCSLEVELLGAAPTDRYTCSACRSADMHSCHL